MAEELPPSLFNILRADLKDTRTEINQRLDGLAAQMVTQAMLAQVQANQKERDDRQDDRIRELERHDEEREKDFRRVQDEQRKTKAQQLFALGLAAFGAVLSIIGGVVVWSITQGMQQLAGG